MDRHEIVDRLFGMRDEKYASFQQSLLPTVDPASIIGVRTPALRQLAREIRQSAGPEELRAFLGILPHRYFDENQLHAFLISLEKDFAACISQVEAFLPYVDNWATCDQLSPKCFQKHRAELIPFIQKWLCDSHPFTVRFALGMLMQHYLDDAFDPVYLQWAAAVQSEEYYVNMMVAWYFATALAKQYDAALPYLENRRLSPWTHSKTIQKAVESYRIPDDRKACLKSLRLKQG